MTTASSLHTAIRAGIERGILPPDATPPPQDHRPWPVVLLTALGAWLSALPLMGVVGMLLHDIVNEASGPYIVAVLLLAGALTVLRSRSVPIFVEQLAIPALMVGLGALGFGLYRDLPDRAAAVLGVAVVLALAAVIARPWLRTLLGAAAAGLCAAALLPPKALNASNTSMLMFWVALHGTLFAWLAAMAAQDRALLQGSRARLAALVESVGAGWVLTVLAGMAWWSGMTFLVGGNLGSGFAGAVAREIASGSPKGLGLNDAMVRACSIALAGFAVLVAGRGWPALRQPAAAAVGLVLAALCWFLPTLGGVLLALAWAATSQRWRVATAAAVAAAWIVGSFYYQLSWPLAHKALVLAAAGAALGAIAWFARPSSAQGPAMPPRQRQAMAWLLAGAALTVLLANVSIWQKETLIANGEKVFVRLAPVDPRSLMQGDFMRLNYAVPGGNGVESKQMVTAQRPYVIARRDERGVAQLLRVASGDTVLQPGEMRIELAPKDGRWILVTDAWFFREGDGQRFEKAKYGEFRVAPDGKALLVGLADEQLKAIPVSP